MICIFIFFVVVSAFPCYFVAFCQRFIYEYMDMDGWSVVETVHVFKSDVQSVSLTFRADTFKQLITPLIHCSVVNEMF